MTAHNPHHAAPPPRPAHIPNMWCDGGPACPGNGGGHDVKAPPREATRADLPKGREAQCPICWRMFGSDWACERHKPYRRPVTRECKEPSSVGLNPFEKRGLVIWYVGAPRKGGFTHQQSNGGHPVECTCPCHQATSVLLPTCPCQTG